MKKIVKRIVLIVLSVVLLASIVIGFIFRGEIASMMTMKKISEYPFYEITMKNDYGLDTYREKGAATDEELTTFITNQMLKGLVKIDANPDGSCSTFCAKTANEDVLMGRNFDYYASTVMLVHCNPKNAYKSISVVNLTHVGFNNDNKPEDSLMNRMKVLAAPYIILDGMNEKGLAVGVLTVKEQAVHQKNGKVPVTTTAAMRMVLDYTATVEEAIELLKNVDMNSSGDSGFHFQITDATGDSAVVEYIDGKMQVVRKKAEDITLVATNFTLATKEQNGSGQERYQIIMDDLAAKKGIITEDEAMEILKGAYFVGTEFYADKPSHPYYNCETQWTTIYNLTQKTMKLTTGMNDDTVYEFSLSSK